MQATGATRKSYTRNGGARQGSPIHQLQTIYDGAGRAVQVRYQLVDLDDLIVSHTQDLRENPAFPSELQPRDRTRATSEAQIHAIVADFQPERLGFSPDAATGAPVVGPDGVVESGNGRVLALGRVLAEGGAQAAAYKAFLLKQGFDPTAFRQPVLIRRRVSEFADAEDRRAFTVNSQKSGTLELSATEQAAADAHLLDPILHMLEGPDVTQARLFPSPTSCVTFSRCPQNLLTSDSDQVIVLP